MGGLLAYLLTKKIIENNHKAPLHLFITGTTGPASLSRTEKKKHLLPKNEFINELKEFDGMPDEVLTNEELLAYFEPILRADFKATENYMHEEDEPLNIPITVITGSEEDMEISDIQLWQKVTKSVVSFKRMPGKHFFIFNYPNEIIEIISKKLFVHTQSYQL
jgi:surfactin synthase thioesterase subunit